MWTKERKIQMKEFSHLFSPIKVGEKVVKKQSFYASYQYKLS